MCVIVHEGMLKLNSKSQVTYSRRLHELGQFERGREGKGVCVCVCVRGVREREMGVFNARTYMRAQAHAHSLITRTHILYPLFPSLYHPPPTHTHTHTQELRGNIRVFCRVRPLSSKNIADGAKSAVK